MGAMTLVKVEPIGTRQAEGFAMRQHGGCGYATWEQAVYPESPEGEALRRLRVERGLALRRAADILGVRAVDLSAVEMGRMRFEDFSAATRRLSVYRGPGRQRAGA